MRISQLIAPLSAAAISALPLGQTAYAELLIKVDKSAQRMAVSVNGEQLYNWPVTTGGSGYDTPGGQFQWTNKASNTNAARRILQDWARKLRESLDRINGKEK